MCSVTHPSWFWLSPIRPACWSWKGKCPAQERLKLETKRHYFEISSAPGVNNMPFPSNSCRTSLLCNITTHILQMQRQPWHCCSIQAIIRAIPWLSPPWPIPTHSTMLLSLCPCFGYCSIAPSAVAKPHSGDTASKPRLEVQRLEAAPKVTLPWVSLFAFKVICQFPCHCLPLECFGPHRNTNGCIWQPPSL